MVWQNGNTPVKNGVFSLGTLVGIFLKRVDGPMTFQFDSDRLVVYENSRFCHTRCEEKW